MKKSVAITLGVVIVGAGSWVGATWYTGKRIEEDAQRHLAQANEKLAKITPLFGLRIDQLKYERGLFSTQARYGVSLVKNDKGLDDLPAGMIEFDANVGDINRLWLEGLIESANGAAGMRLLPEPEAG